jgi:hypothetical protein
MIILVRTLKIIKNDGHLKQNIEIKTGKDLRTTAYVI